VWFEVYHSIDKAISREKQIKRWRREKKIALIVMDNPTWVDLSEPWRNQKPFFVSMKPPTTLVIRPQPYREPSAPRKIICRPSV